MKVGVTTHPKFLRLVRHLRKSGEIGDISPNLIAIGLLEGLWNLTAQHYKMGDIGKMTNVDIAEGLHWHGDENNLVSYLVDSGWIDESEEHRLVIHDWQEHCPTYIKGIMGREKTKPNLTTTKSATKSETKLPTKSATKSETKDETKCETKEPTTYSILSYPILSKPNLSKEEVNIVDPSESTTTKNPVSKSTKTKKANIAYDDEFESYWKQHLPFNRMGDSKAKAQQRYRTCRREGLSQQDIFQGTAHWQRSNEVTEIEYRKGLSNWLYVDNIRQVIDGHAIEPKAKKTEMQQKFERLDKIFPVDGDKNMFDPNDEEGPFLLESK